MVKCWPIEDWFCVCVLNCVLVGYEKFLLHKRYIP